MAYYRAWRSNFAERFGTTYAAQSRARAASRPRPATADPRPV
jgi:hypothetical protein